MRRTPYGRPIDRAPLLRRVRGLLGPLEAKVLDYLWARRRPLLVREIRKGVRRRLAPVIAAPSRRPLRLLAPVLLLPIAALPLYPAIHQLVEALIAVGR